MNGGDEPLPSTVESILQRICYDQNQTPPDKTARKRLSQLGEETSLRILNNIAKCNIKKSLSCYIVFMANKYNPTTNANANANAASTSNPSLTITSFYSPVSSPTSNGISSNSPLAKRQLFSPPSSSEKPSTSSTRRLDPQLLNASEKLLSELEFRKAFLIRSYLGGAELVDTVAVSDFRRWKDLPMADFESEVWNNLGRRCLPKKDFSNISCDETKRPKARDWDSGMTHSYECHVLPNGSYIFKGPSLSTTKSHLQRILGDENVLMVKLAVEVSSSSNKIYQFSNYSSAFNTIAEEGIFIGLRRYRFFVFKDGGKEEKKKNSTSSSVKCFFVRMESLARGDVLENYPLTNKTMYESRCLFMHAHMVPTMAKYIARFSLILSTTIKLPVDMSSVSVLEEDDIPCQDENGCIVYNEDNEPLIHTDGTGFISEDLALLTPKGFTTAKYISKENVENFLNVDLEKLLDPGESASHSKEPPLLMQIRLFNKGIAVKGTLLLNKQLPPRTIVIRPSMLKVQMDAKRSNEQTFNSLEIVGVSKRPNTTYLSKNLISLLAYGGVSKEFFLNILGSALQDAQTVCTNMRAAVKATLSYGEIDDNIVTVMILSGIPLNEPYLQSRLRAFAIQERNALKSFKIPISESFYLMGTTDPTGLLERNQVCIIMENGQLSGPVLVYRNPGLHFGDVHILEATYVKEMELFVGNAKYGIFFSTKGRRSVGSELANGDFDGDMYWVSRNPELLSSFRPSEPWRRIYSTPSKPSKKPSELSADELEQELFRMFLRTRFQRSSCMGVAADSWIAHMDRLLMLGESCAAEKIRMEKLMIQLVDLYYDALDAPKSGKQVVLPEKLIAREFPHYMERDRTYKSSSVLGLLYDMTESYQTVSPAACGDDVWKLPCFNIVIPDTCFKIWGERYNRYRTEMSAAINSPGKEENSKNIAANGVYQKYKQLLYDAPEFENSPKNPQEIYNEAIAIYHVSYNRADQMSDAKYCSFAWKVAGSALCKLHDKTQKSIPCSLSVLRELLK